MYFIIGLVCKISVDFYYIYVAHFIFSELCLILIFQLLVWTLLGSVYPVYLPHPLYLITLN